MKKRSIISLALLAAGLAFIVIGAVRGEANAVMQKAIMIFMECIGLG
ncbi:MAG: thioredoxin [Christensenellaceae bacterium]|nr:thioredoxin [Christensenellaceae bacterium]